MGPYITRNLRMLSKKLLPVRHVVNIWLEQDTDYDVQQVLQVGRGPVFGQVGVLIDRHEDHSYVLKLE